jgi:hypothetical protein
LLRTLLSTIEILPPTAIATAAPMTTWRAQVRNYPGETVMLTGREAAVAEVLVVMIVVRVRVMV